ncbi:MAG: TonB-dependent receptor [Vicinamibacterales bacterium]
MKVCRLAGAAVLALCLSVFAHAAVAQESLNQATVSGRVTDPQGAVVPGATVTAKQTETNLTAETVADSEGRFRFPLLKIGPYEFTARLQGFAPTVRAVTLTVGSAFELSMALSVEALTATVSVTAAGTVLEAARSQIASTITQAEVVNLPMNGRNFLDLALLVPGVSPPNISSTQLFAETSAVPGVGLSIGSQRNFSNGFIVDGLSANDDAAGLSGTPFGVDAIEQFQVVTSGGQAELGRALGGYVNIVTKSGTNAARGNLYGYFRDDNFNAKNALSGTKLPMSQQQYGGSLGGPVRRDRTFYFVNVEQRKLDQTGFVTVPQPTVGIISARLSAVGYPGAPVTTGIYPNPVNSLNVLGKIDQQISGADQLSIRYSLYDVTSSNSRGAGGLNTPSASAGLDNRDQGIAIGNTMSLSSRLVNETRGQFVHSDLVALPTDRVGPNVNIAGVATLGTFASSPTGRLNTMYQVVDNVSYLAGAHALRGGVDFLYNHDEINFLRSVRGQYAFSSLANFLAGTYNNAGFTQTFGAVDVSQNNPNLGIYAQDEWRVTPGLTLNLGLRYDLQFIETINTDTNNVSPRAGFAWSPSARGRTVLRGSAGLFFDRVPLRGVANALLSAGNTTDITNLRQINISLSPTQAGAPTFPNILSAPVPLVTLVNLTTMNRDIQNGNSRQGNVEIEQQIGDLGTVSGGYQYLRGERLMMAINQNVPSCVAAGTNNGCRPNATYANDNRYVSQGTSTYHGMTLAFVQRPARWGNYRVSYTLSKSMNNVGEAFFSQPIDPFDVSKDWGRSDGDQRHRLVLNGSVHTATDAGTTAWEKLTHGFQASAMLQFYSALPLNITSGVTTLQGTPGRPIVNGSFIERNAGTGADFFNLNARLSRSFSLGGSTRIEGVVEAFNLTNRRNVTGWNANFGAGAYPTNPSPTFKQVTAVADPRSLQFALRLTF